MISDRIRAVRKSKGLTQKRLGELCGIAEPTIRKYELGKLNPKYETIAKIAAALEISIVDLMGWDEQYPNVGADCVLYEKALETNTPFGKAVTLLAQLNEDGQAKAIAYMQDLLKIESYCVPENEK